MSAFTVRVKKITLRAPLASTSLGSPKFATTIGCTKESNTAATAAYSASVKPPEGFARSATTTAAPVAAGASVPVPLTVSWSGAAALAR